MPFDKVRRALLSRSPPSSVENPQCVQVLRHRLDAAIKPGMP